MIYKYRLTLGIIVIVTSIFLLGISMVTGTLLLLIISLILLVVSTLYSIFTFSIEIFVKDKQLDFDALQKQGLNVIMCPNCIRNNIKEDIFCIYCGERLETYDE